MAVIGTRMVVVCSINHSTKIRYIIEEVLLNLAYSLDSPRIC